MILATDEINILENRGYYRAQVDRTEGDARLLTAFELGDLVESWQKTGESVKFLKWAKVKDEKNSIRLARFICPSETCNRSFYTYHKEEVSCCPHCGLQIQEKK